MTAAAVLLKIPFSSTMAGIGLGLAAGAGVVLLLTMGVVQLSWFVN
jgi:anaerobic C4-dicarboxylate transporter